MVAKRWRKNLIAMSVTLSVCAASVAWAWDTFNVSTNKSAAPVGLSGILEPFPPDALSFDAFEALDGNWSDWSEETLGLISKLYEDPSLDLEGQRELIERLKTKSKTMEKAIRDPRYGKIHDDLISLNGALTRRIELFEAILDSQEIDGEALKLQKLADSQKDVVQAASNLNRWLRGITNGSGWVKFLASDKIAKVSKTEPLNKDNRQLLLNALRNLKEKDKLKSQAQRSFLGRSRFSTLKAALESYERADTFKPKKADPGKFRKAAAELITAVESFEAGYSDVAAAEIAVASQKIEVASTDGGQLIAKVLDRHYQNFNFKVFISEDFINRLITKRHTEKGEVRDFILGANVSGSQTTTTRIGVDFKPRDDAALFDITLNGTTNSNTRGVTSEATIFTRGNHHIFGRKQIVFDGDTFETRKARVTVDANNRHVGTATRVSGVPILGSIANRIARREVARKRPQSEAIAAGKVKRRVLPRFDEEVDERFVEANEEIDDGLHTNLKNAGVWPAERLLQTTSKDMIVNALIREGVESGGNPANLSLAKSKGLNVFLHESLFNNTFNRMDIAGRTLTDTQLRKEFEKFLSKLAGEEVLLGDDEEAEDETTYIFARNDPIRIRFQDGDVQLVLRAGIKQKGEEDIPTQEVVVPMTYTLSGDEILIERGTVAVTPIEKPESLAKQIARAGVMRKKIQSAIENRTRPRILTIKRNDGSKVKVNVTQIRALDGWLTVSVE